MEMTPLRHQTEIWQALSRHIFVRVSQSVGQFKVGPALSLFAKNRKTARKSRRGRNNLGVRTRSLGMARLREQGEMMNWARNNQTSAKGLAGCAVLAILTVSSPAKAHTCPTGTAVPFQTIKIFNDTNQYIFAELEVGLNDPDQCIQMACNITRTQA